MFGMTKREIILITAAIVAVLYGINAFLGDGGSRKPDGQDPANRFQSGTESEYAMEIVTRLKNERFSEYELYLLNQTQLPWGDSPFLATDLPVELDSAPAPKAAETPLRQFVYSGYVQMGDGLIGVINGMEYQAGEPLAEDNQLVVSAIYPDHVVIVEIEGTLRYTIPLDDNGRDSHESNR